MTQRTHRTRVLAALCVACTGLCLFLYGKGYIPLLESELGVKDLLLLTGRTLAPDDRLTFLGIDQPSYADVIAPEEAAADPALAAMTGSFPWPRNVWAAAIERLITAGAKVVVIDLVFPAPTPADDVLKAVLERHRDKVVIGANFLSASRTSGESQSLLLPSESLITTTNGEVWADERVGFVNFFPDLDDVVRRATFRVNSGRGLPPGGTMKSLGARALEKFGSGRLVPSDTRSRLFRFSAPPGLGYKAIPLYTIFLPTHWTNNFAAGKYFEGRIVLIGPAANIFHDEHRTPYSDGAMLGPEIHLNAIGAALRGEFLGESPFTYNLLCIAALGAFAFALAVMVKGPIRRLFVAASLAAAYVATCWLMFNYANYALIAVTPVLALSSSTLAGFTYDFVLLRLEKNRTRRTLERYVSKDVVREVLDNPETYLNTLGGVRKPVTILFSDVRGFTTLTEGADPAQLVLQLNEYFKEMVDIVFAHQGSLDKFIGDAVMALWGSITSQGIERDAQNAVAAALAMRKSLARLNVNWNQRGMKELSFGIGINHGDAIVGNLGSEQKMEVSVIGDPVNLASRLEGLTKEYKLDLLLGEAMVPLVHRRFILRTVGSVQVKGKTQAARVFTVVADGDAGEQAPVWLARYEQGIELYRRRKFAEGAEAFAHCLREQPGDHLSQLHLDACRELMANPPGLDWDTVVIMKTK